MMFFLNLTLLVLAFSSSLPNERVALAMDSHNLSSSQIEAVQVDNSNAEKEPHGDMRANAVSGRSPVDSSMERAY